VLYLASLPWGWKTYRDHERNAAAAQPSATAEAAAPSTPAATFSPAPDDADDNRPVRLN
jgi:CDP-diacylglycerol---serine O-phosphatidyltransferase